MDKTPDAAKACRSNATIKASFLFWRRSNRSRSSMIWIAINCSICSRPALNELGVELIEQPFPADADDVLETLEHPIPVCADESCHTTIELLNLKNRYEAINIKLDKTGGLTEALQVYQRARENNFKILIGCMVCTSLSIAPARLLASNADWVDLDGPLLVARDRDNGLPYRGGRIGMPARELWG